MRKMRRGSFLLFLVGFAGWTALADDGGVPMRRDRNRPVTVIPSGQGIVLSVPGGDIGTCTLLRPAGGWPAQVTLRLVWKRPVGGTYYEGFFLSTDRWKLGESLRPGKNEWLLRRADAAGKFRNDPRERTETIHAVVQETAAALEFVIPAALFEGTPRIEVQWIDFYR